MQSCARLLSQYARRSSTTFSIGRRGTVGVAASSGPSSPSSPSATTATAMGDRPTPEDEASRRPAPTEPLLSIAPM
jgi:hypothetical protein